MVTDKQKRNLDYFKNKIVTIFTSPINRQFSEQELLEYFVGKITSIDDNGIWYEHLKTKCLNFIFYDKITSISEERFISADQAEQMAEEIVKNEVQITDEGEIKPLESPKTVSDLKSLLGI
jgi:hypothetical protein